MTDALENSILAKMITATRQIVLLHDVRLAAESRFAEDLNLDSLNVTEIVLHIEEVFRTKFTPEAVARFRRLADMVDFISHRYFSDATDLALAERA